MIIRYFDAFAGIGGFSVGIDRAMPDAVCVGYSEVDKSAIQIYKKHYPNRTNYGDITAIDTKELPDFDLFCGGFPCQDLSIAGKRAGLCGTRSGLFFEAVRIIREKQPVLVFFENVKGLLSSNKGWDFARVLIELEDSGYDAEWAVCNSKSHGVPQNRERVFIIGHLRGRSRFQVFPLGRDIEKDVEIQQGQRAEGVRIPCLNSRYGQRWTSEAYIRTGCGKVAVKTQRSEEQKRIRKESMKQGRDWNPRQGRELTIRDDNLMNTITSNWEVNQSVFDCATSSVRRLTPLECERLQSFDDSWTEYGIDGNRISDIQRYKCLGNAVTVNVIEAIVRKIKLCIDSIESDNNNIQESDQEDKEV